MVLGNQGTATQKGQSPEQRLVGCGPRPHQDQKQGISPRERKSTVAASGVPDDPPKHDRPKVKSHFPWELILFIDLLIQLYRSISDQ